MSTQDWVSRWLAARWLTLLLCVALTVACGIGLQRLTFTTDYRVYFSHDNPELAALEKLEQNFTRAETVFFALAPKSGEVFSVETLSAVRWLTERWADVPYARGGSSLTTFYEARADGDDISAAPLIPEGPLDELDLGAIRERALNEPRLVNGILSAKGDVTGVAYYFELPHEQPAEEIRAVTRACRALAEELTQRYPDIDVHIAGVIFFNEAMSQAMLQDARFLNPLSAGLMLVLLALFFRSITATAATLVVIVMANVTALGAAGWFGITLSAASIAAGVIILTLAIADCVHLVTTFGLARSQGNAPLPAMAHSLRVNGRAVFLTSLTTALGFLGMNFSVSPPFRDLGNIVAIGVIAAWICSVAVLPAILIALPPRRAPLAADQTALMRRLADFNIRHWRKLLGASLVVVAAAAACLPLNQFGDDYVGFFPEENEFRRASEFTSRNLTGVQYVEYGVFSDEPGGVYEPRYLRHLEAFVTWLRSQPEVIKASTVVDLLRRLNETMHGGDPAYYRLPDSRETSAQYLLFYEMSLPAGVDITNLVNMDKSAARVSVQLTELTSEEVRQFDARVQEWMRTHWPAELRTPGSGISMMFANIARRNFASMMQGTAISFTLIAILLFLSFGSLRLGLLSMVPNLVPAIVGFGLWGLLVGNVGMSLSVVVSLTLGIVVDDTIHLMSRYGRARREKNLAAPDALRDAFASVGTALWATSAVLVAGFFVMMFSGFQLTAHLGALTAMIIALALACDFLLLPSLLLWLDRKT